MRLSASTRSTLHLQEEITLRSRAIKKTIVKSKYWEDNACLIKIIVIFAYQFK